MLRSDSRPRWIVRVEYPLRAIWRVGLRTLRYRSIQNAPLTLPCTFDGGQRSVWDTAACFGCRASQKSFSKFSPPDTNDDLFVLVDGGPDLSVLCHSDMHAIIYDGRTFDVGQSKELRSRIPIARVIRPFFIVGLELGWNGKNINVKPHCNLDPNKIGMALTTR